MSGAAMTVGTPSLFDFSAAMPAARHTDPTTSVAAKVSACRSAVGHAKVVLAALVEHGPMTDHELADITGLGDNARKRRSGLTKTNPSLVVSTGTTRPSPSGCAATVWVATETGEAVHRGGDDGEARE